MAAWQERTPCAHDAKVPHFAAATQRYAESMQQLSLQCAKCDAVMPHNAAVTNHILHLLMSLFTIGIWLVVWLVVAVKNADTKAKCVKCGTERPAK